MKRKRKERRGEEGEQDEGKGVEEEGRVGCSLSHRQLQPSSELNGAKKQTQGRE